jgi:5-dehydro-2-deoxygluconokinase
VTELELLTVGRISIDLYCDQIGADWHAARSFTKVVGGSPTNVAIAAARLGHRAAVFTKVGDDPFGEVALAELRDLGVDRRFVGVERGHVTPLAFAVLDPPAQPQLWFRREPPVPDLQLRPGEVDRATTTGVPILWISAGALSSGPSAALLCGWPPERAVAFANAAGGIVASQLLCSQAMPYAHEVSELLVGSFA